MVSRSDRFDHARERYRQPDNDGDPKSRSVCRDRSVPLFPPESLVAGAIAEASLEVLVTDWPVLQVQLIW